MHKMIRLSVLLNIILVWGSAVALGQGTVYQWARCDTMEPINQLAVDLEYPDPIWGISAYSVFRMDGRKGFWSPAGLRFESQDLSAIATSNEAAGTAFVGTKTGMIYKHVESLGGWQWMGQLGSQWNQINAISVSRPNPSTVYAATSHSGLFVSRDAGVSWQSTQLSDREISAVLAHPAQPATAFCLGRDHLYQSDDYGSTWIMKDIWIYGNESKLSIENFPPYRLFLIHRPGTLQVSEDSGTHWEILLERDIIKMLSVDPLIPDRLFFADNDYILETTDGGSTWSTIRRTGGADSLITDPVRPDVVYISGPSRGIRRPGDTDWQTSGPLGGNIHAIRPDRFSQGRIWVGLTNGGGWEGSNFVESHGIYHSSDHGVVWNPLPWKGLPLYAYPPLGVSDLVIAPSDPQVIIGILTDSLRLTTNGGQTWESRGIAYESQDIHSLAIHPENPQVVYAGIDDGIYQTTNLGADWRELVSSPQTVIQSLLIHPSEPATIYAATLDMGVWKTTDAGESWNDFNQGLPELDVVDLAFSAVNKRVLYAGTRTQGLYRSTNAGESWARRSIDFGAPLSDVEVDPLRTARVYVATSGAGVFRSDDAGGHWQAVSSGLANPFIQCIAADSFVPDILYAGASFAGLFRSSDGGLSWTHSGVRPANTKSVRVDPTEGNIVYAGTDADGLFVSQDWGESWTPLPTGLPDPSIQMVSFDFLSPDNLYVGTAGKGLFRTNDWGQSWQELNDGLNPDGDTFFKITGFAASQHDPTTLFAATDQSSLLKSTDAGSSWISQHFGTHVSNIKIDPLDWRRMYLISYNRPYRSLNGGQSFWAMGSSALYYKILALHPLIPSWLYMYNDNSSAGRFVHLSSDGGYTWLSIPWGRSYVRAIEPLPADPACFYLGGSNQNLERNDEIVTRFENHGKVWRPCTGMIPPCVVWDLEAHPGEPGLIFAATEYGVFHRFFLGSGDADNDGVFTATDYDALGMFLAETWEGMGERTLEVVEPMDTDGNGRVNIVDMLLLKYRLQQQMPN